jgi:hypothetical protein
MPQYFLTALSGAPGALIERQAPARLTGGAADPLFPRGDLTFSGAVDWLNGERPVLHTRTDFEKTILLRQDTSFVVEGDADGCLCAA